MLVPHTTHAAQYARAGRRVATYSAAGQYRLTTAPTALSVVAVKWTTPGRTATVLPDELCPVHDLVDIYAVEPTSAHEEAVAWAFSFAIVLVIVERDHPPLTSWTCGRRRARRRRIP
jgi:hypothetical protein